MGKKSAALAIVSGLVLAVGCNGTEVNLSNVRPTGFGVSTASTVGIRPSVVSSQAITDASCPTVPPFVGSVNLTVRTNGDFGVSLREVRMQFTDRSGITAPQITLPAPVLTQQFGSTLVQARSERAFPFAFRFGCGTGRAGRLVVIVVARDEQGRDSSNTVQAEVR